MALMRKPDNSKKKGPDRKEAGIKEVSNKTLKTIVLNKDNKSAVKKDTAKVVVKKDKVNHVEDIKKFFRGVLNELKKVHWLNSREVIIYTSVVLFAVIAVGSMIWVFDSVFSSLLKLIMQR
ncbi:MAG: preprotein translocase subunit SecE [Pelotomaculum sp. PtaU1.Bin035]|nr:MAG: preprotein translocase subunit SecE [Pelotomaculum sp. PtaU1.Bin035]